MINQDLKLIFEPAGYSNLSTATIFLHHEQKAIPVVLRQIRSEHIIADFSILSVPFVLKWIFGKAQTGQNQDEIHELLMHAAYYMGESFVRSTGFLSWQIKDNLPIVKEDRTNFTLSPIQEISKLFSQIMQLSHGQKANTKEQSHDDIDNLLINWLIGI